MFPIFPAGPFRLRNAALPVALLERGQQGDAKSDRLVMADIAIADGKIRAIDLHGRHGVTVGRDPAVDLDGGMVWPGCVDVHTHLDQGHIWPRAVNPTGSFDDAVALKRADGANWTPDDVARRMDFALRCAHAHGTVAIRTHLTGIEPVASLSWRVFDEMRRRWAGRIALQPVGLIPLNFYEGEAGRHLADKVAQYGGVLGAFVRSQHDTARQFDCLFALARERDLDLDIHADETGDPASNALEDIAEATIRHGWEGRVTAGHCCSLAMRPPADAARTIARVAAAGVSVVALPMCNAYLQDRAPGRTPRWRGVTLMQELAAAGVRVATATDATRDPFYPYGDLDPVEVFAQAVRLAQLDHPLGGWVRAVTATPAAIMGLDSAGAIAVGGPADLLLFRARDWSELLARPWGPRLVLRDGQPLTETVPDFRELDAIFARPARAAELH